MSKKPKSLKFRLLSSFGGVCLSLVALAILITGSMAGISSIQKQITVQNQELEPLYLAEASHLKWANSLSLHLNYGQPFSGSIDSKSCDFGKWLYGSSHTHAPEFQSFLSQIEPLHNRVHSSAKNILELLSTNPERAHELYLSETLPAVNDLITSLDSAIDRQDLAVVAATDQQYRVMQFTIISCVLASLIVLFLLFLLFRFLRQDVCGNLQLLSEQLVCLSRGSLNLHIPPADGLKTLEIYNIRNALSDAVSELKTYIEIIDSDMEQFSNGNFSTIHTIPFKGDFSNIQKSVERFQARMNLSFGKMDSAASSVSAGAAQVADSAQALAQGATQQASSVQELSATVAEISSRLSETAEYSKTADDLGKRTGEVVLKSQDEMRQLMEAIKEIASGAKDIQKIIKVIDDIAFQTNILALNAAVEAARAGAAGKGFAVVADEVRNLAQKSAEAAQNTTVLIENSLRSVSLGEQLSDNTEAAFNEMADYSNQIVSMIEKIAESSNEQAVAVSQISLGIEQISSVVQMNSATSEESAAASEQLSSEANQMKALLDQFQTANKQSASLGAEAQSASADSFSGFDADSSGKY